MSVKLSCFLLLLFLGFVPVFSGCAASPDSLSVSAPASRSGEPSWVRDPYTKYDRHANVAAVGMACSREMAEKNAFSGLVAIFGQSIRVDEKVSSSYRDAVRKGVNTGWSEDTVVDKIVVTSAGMDSLIGAEILDRWDDGNNFYASAVLNKAKAVRIYSGMINSNLALIEKLTDVPYEEKNSFNGYARYQIAATVADMTVPYANLLSIIGAPLPDFRRGEDYRLDAVTIAGSIPVGLAVHNDKSGRIHGAFAKALSDLGFLTGGTEPPYLLDVNITTTPCVFTGNPYKYTRIELKAELKDAKTLNVFLPYIFNIREGHTTQEEADNRAFASAARKINAEYSNLLKNRLSAY